MNAYFLFLLQEYFVSIATKPCYIVIRKMSYFTLPVIFLNLGGEMFYVLDQRLKAQKVPQDKAKKVLNEIATIMLNKKFLEELFKPQLIYNKEALYTLFRDIAHASIMKLNDASMGKLYDLMIMVFKYQVFAVASPKDILFITLNHLDSLRHLVTSPSVYKQLDMVYILLLKTHFTLPQSELQRIRYDILNFFQDIHTKVSIFLRQGQQNSDGTFSIPTKSVISRGFETPGVIRLLNSDSTVRDILHFLPGGEYTVSSESGSLDVNGSRGTTLGLSIYGESSSNTENLWWDSEEYKASDRWGTLEPRTAYKEELNMLVNELLGNRHHQNEEQFIQLDLFKRDMKGHRPDNNAFRPRINTITMEGNANNSALNKVVTEMKEETSDDIKQEQPIDVLQLLESVE